MKETKLNVKQKEAIVAITTPLSVQLPPVLIIGNLIFLRNATLTCLPPLLTSMFLSTCRSFWYWQDLHLSSGYKTATHCA